MPYGYTPPAWLNNTQPTPSTGGNRPPTERVWEEDRRDEPTVSIDYTPPVDTSQPADISSPIVSIDEAIDGRSAALQTVADESANKYLTGVAEMATDEYGRLRNIYDLETNDPLLTFEDGKVVRDGGFKRDDQGQYYIPPFEGVGDKGQLLSDLERMQLAALKMGHKTSLGDPVHGGSQFESGLGSLVSLDSEGNPVYTDEGELILSGLGQSVMDNWNQLITGYDDPSGYGQGDIMQDIIDNYYADPWDSWTDPWYGGHQQFQPGTIDSMADLARHTWFSESLADVERREQERLEAGLDVATMSDMEDIFGEEFGGGANPLFDPGYSQSSTAEMNPLAADITLFEQARS